MGFLDSLKKILSISNDSLDYENIQAVEKIIGYSFHSPALLQLALTHRSFNKNKDNNYYSNERLEFLGDSVLGLVIADRLYHDYPDLREGKLTKMKALLVNEITLSNVGQSLELNKYIRMSFDEEKLGGRERQSIVSDAMESIFGSVYLDGGYDIVGDIIIRLIYSKREAILSDKSQTNYKGDLLELVQAQGKGMPNYQLVDESGPDHEKEFNIDVYVENKKIGSGIGLTKKEAEQRAAAMALESMQSVTDPKTNQ